MHLLVWWYLDKTFRGLNDAGIKERSRKCGLKVIQRSEDSLAISLRNLDWQGQARVAVVVLSGGETTVFHSEDDSPGKRSSSPAKDFQEETQETESTG